jgi:hypothetical protein
MHMQPEARVGLQAPKHYPWHGLASPPLPDLCVAGPLGLYPREPSRCAPLAQCTQRGFVQLFLDKPGISLPRAFRRF